MHLHHRLCSHSKTAVFLRPLAYFCTLLDHAHTEVLSLLLAQLHTVGLQQGRAGLATAGGQEGCQRTALLLDTFMCSTCLHMPSQVLRC